LLPQARPAQQSALLLQARLAPVQQKPPVQGSPPQQSVAVSQARLLPWQQVLLSLTSQFPQQHSALLVQVVVFGRQHQPASQP
jgi:hypothetical protein